MVGRGYAFTHGIVKFDCQQCQFYNVQIVAKRPTISDFLIYLNRSGGVLNRHESVGRLMTGLMDSKPRDA